MLMILINPALSACRTGSVPGPGSVALARLSQTKFSWVVERPASPEIRFAICCTWLNKESDASSLSTQLRLRHEFLRDRWRNWIHQDGMTRTSVVVLRRTGSGSELANCPLVFSAWKWDVASAISVKLLW